MTQGKGPTTYRDSQIPPTERVPQSLPRVLAEPAAKAVTDDRRKKKPAPAARVKPKARR